MTNMNDYLKGYKAGVQNGFKDALVAFQKDNPNKDLPSNEVLYKILELVWKCRERDEALHSVYMNAFERYINYVVQNWNEEK